MAPWDETSPSTGANPVPGAPPNAVTLAMLAAKLFGQQGTPPATGAPGGPTSMPAQVGGAPPQLAGAPAVPGTQASPVPVGTGAPPAGPIPQRQPFQPAPLQTQFPNKQARSGYVVSTGIENISGAITSFKKQKEDKELAQAKTTWDMYQKASQIDPSTGQPVDPHTQQILGSNPKLLKLWEKYITGELPRDNTGSPTSEAKPAGGVKGMMQKLTGKTPPPPGKPMIPVQQASPQAQLQQLQAQQALTQAQGGKTAPGALTNDEQHTAALMAAGIVPKAQDQKSIDKINAEIDEQKALATQHTQDAALAKSRLDELNRQGPLADAKLKNEALRDYNEALAAFARANKDTTELNQSKTLAQFKTVTTGFNDLYKNAASELTQSQKAQQASRGYLDKLWGGVKVTPEQQKMQDKLLAMGQMKAKLDLMQDDVVDGKMSPTDALTKARQDSGLTSNYDKWGGIPSDAPDAKGLPNGAIWRGTNGEALGTVSDGKWVAP